jgi:two-component system CitB family sensor kinase
MTTALRAQRHEFANRLHAISGLLETGQDDAPPASPTSDHGALDDVHGHGFGLPLSRDIARRRGGDVWLASPGVRGEHGAVFCARLPGTVVPAPSMAGDG